MEQNDKQNRNPEQPSVNKRTGDLQDPQRDQERLKPDKAVIDLPDVKDIPGQEHIHPPSLGELADTTISSDDEEGAGLFDEENDAYSLNKNEQSNNDTSTQGNP